MIQSRTLLKVTDNSGIKLVRCIKVLIPKNIRWATIGNIIKVSTINVLGKSKVKKGQVINAIIVRCMRFFSRGSELIRFSDNAIVALTETMELIGTRVFGPILKELRTIHPKLFASVSNIV